LGQLLPILILGQHMLILILGVLLAREYLCCHRGVSEDIYYATLVRVVWELVPEYDTARDLATHWPQTSQLLVAWCSFYPHGLPQI
jgi:hypothetical protein